MFKLGQMVTYYDDTGRSHTGRVSSRVIRIGGSPCVRIKDQWINLDYIVIDGKTPEARKGRIGLMKSCTGGRFGAWKLDYRWIGISEWAYAAPAFMRHYQCAGERGQVAIWVKPRARQKNHMFRVFTPHAELYAEGSMYNLNRTGQHACDLLRKCLLEELDKKEAG